MQGRPYQREAWLREKYCDDGLTLEEMADACDASISTIPRWMDKYDIERRSSWVSRSSLHPSIFTEREGYVRAASQQDYARLHRLLAVAEHGFDAVCGADVHHRNDIPWDNRPDNIRLLTRAEHAREHMNQRYADHEEPYHDPEWLREQYHEQGKTLAEVGEAAGGITPQTVSYWMDKHDIERRDSRYTSD